MFYFILNYSPGFHWFVRFVLPFGVAGSFSSYIMILPKYISSVFEMLYSSGKSQDSPGLSCISPVCLPSDLQKIQVFSWGFRCLWATGTLYRKIKFGGEKIKLAIHLIFWIGMTCAPFPVLWLEMRFLPEVCSQYPLHNVYSSPLLSKSRK